jgi:hypothetical protein
MDKKICVVRVKNGATVMIGGYKNGRLMVAKWKAFKGDIASVAAAAAAYVTEYKLKGFIIAVDDVYNQLPFSALRTGLSDTDSNGMPRLVLALNAYRSLQQLRSITFADGCPRIDVNETVTEPLIDGNGRTTYIIDWEAFKEEQLAILLLSYHALHHQPQEVTYLQQYFGHLALIKATGSRSTVRGFRL